VTCFLTTGIDCLVVGDYVVTKPRQPDLAQVRRLAAGLREHQKLVRRGAAGASQHSIESAASSFFTHPRTPISRDVYAVLAGEAAGSIEERCRGAGIGGEERIAALTRELLQLWDRRAVVLLPGAAAGG
jgi:carbamoyltransferase